MSRVRATPLYALKLACFVLASLRSVLGSRADVVNAHWLVPQGAVALLARALGRAKVVVTVHGGDVFSLNGGLLRRVKGALLARADAVVVNSSATREACEELFPGREYVVVPMGVDTERFSPGKRSAALAAAHSLGGFTVLFVGRLTEDKGVVHLLEALALLRERGTDVTALVVGAGDQEEELRQVAVARGLRDAVRFVGWVDSADLPAYYRTADVFVAPSVVGRHGWKEALGLVLVEASASGLPVVATRTGGIADVVDDGVTGFLVDQAAPEQIARKLELLSRDEALRARLGAGGRARVEQRFSWPAVADRYEEVLRSVSAG